MAQPHRLRKLAEIVRDYVKKGQQALRRGPSHHPKLDDKESGKKVYRTEIVVGDISLLSGRGEEGGSTGGSYQQRGGSSNTSSFDQRPPAATTTPHSAEITDDDIPF